MSGNQYPNGASIEMDFYGGWKHAWGDFGLDLGTIYYAYPGGTKLPDLDSNGNTAFTTVKNFEGYVGGSWKWFSAKYFYSFTDYFGLSQDAVTSLCNPINGPGARLSARNGNTKGTSYLIGAFNYRDHAQAHSLTATAGYTWVNNYDNLDYFDYKVGVTYDLDGWLLGARIIGTDAEKDYWYATATAPTKSARSAPPASSFRSARHSERWPVAGPAFRPAATRVGGVA